MGVHGNFSGWNFFRALLVLVLNRVWMEPHLVGGTLIHKNILCIYIQYVYDASITTYVLSALVCIFK